jgi:hypothetical protein
VSEQGGDPGDAELNDADAIAARVLEDATQLTVTDDELRWLAAEYRRVVQERDEWKAKHDDVLSGRERLRAAVEALDQ